MRQWQHILVTMSFCTLGVCGVQAQLLMPHRHARTPMHLSPHHYDTFSISARFNTFNASSVMYHLQSPFAQQIQKQAFFCRIESQLERRSRLAPRFRLGSLDYVNYLEGKSGRFSLKAISH